MHTSHQLGGVLLLGSESVTPPHLPAECGNTVQLLDSMSFLRQFCCKAESSTFFATKKAIPGGVRKLIMPLLYDTNTVLTIVCTKIAEIKLSE